jgi:hypothetical protein
MCYVAALVFVGNSTLKDLCCGASLLTIKMQMPVIWAFWLWFNHGAVLIF